jgi:type IV secretory pathway VirB9-like protein
MNILHRSLVSLLLACGSLLAADHAPPATDLAPSARIVSYADRDVVPVNAKIRFTTLIVLPKQESILDYVCGDKEYWIVNGTANFAYIKPAKENSQTNLNLITASGNVYSFVLREISAVPGAQPDLKIFIEPKDESMLSSLDRKPKFVSAAQVEDYRQQAEIAKAEARQAKEQAQATLDSELSRLRSEYPAHLHFVYRFPANDPVFRVSAIYNDGKFTYIYANPQETPALYEIKDGKPNLVNFDYKNGVYVVPKILDNGYLAIGKKKLTFTREE